MEEEKELLFMPYDGNMLCKDSEDTCCLTESSSSNFPTMTSFWTVLADLFCPATHNFPIMTSFWTA